MSAKDCSHEREEREENATMCAKDATMCAR